MKTSRLACLFMSGVALAATLSAQAPKLEFPQPSPAATLKQRVGLTDIVVTYSRPGVKGREVFGGLEKFGRVWRTGANSATKISFSTPVKFGDADVPAGEYALFSIPDPAVWTVILNKVTGQWGAYTYDEKNDVARVKVNAVKLAQPVETFTIDVNDIRDESATLNLVWQNTRVAVPLKFDVISVLVPKIEAALAPGEKASAGLYDRAATFYLDNNLDLAKAKGWIEQAIALQPQAFYYYLHQARILAKAGDKAGAKAAAEKCKAGAAKDTTPARDEYTRLSDELIASLGQ